VIRLVEIEEGKVILEKVEVTRPVTVVGIPAFNEEKTIARVVLETRKYADKVVVCDDGSTDLTPDIARCLGADVIRHERNMGYGAAIRSLFNRALELGADVLVTLDADGQHDPSEISSVVQPIIKGEADIVIGSRFVENHFAYTMPWYRRAGVKFITKLVNNTAKNNVKDAQSGFRAYNRQALETLKVTENGMGVSAEILFSAGKHGMRIQEVSSTCNYDKDTKTSTHNPLKHGTNVVMSIIKLVVEDKPLTSLGIPGILCLIVGAIFGIWMFQIYTVEHYIVTNIALVSIAFILIGFFAISTAITLYAISRFAEKISSKEKRNAGD
jgi:glycosyltransferase involved in cell wall biosynthesis